MGSHFRNATILDHHNAVRIFDGAEAVPDKFRLASPFSEIPAIRSRIFVIVPLVDHLGNDVGDLVRIDSFPDGAAADRFVGEPFGGQ